ncbi:pep-cterm sorting domain-containing protein [Anaeramoeba ignava]|uniref:Pep-cterm sorting domain-containing protein n=1 Tax=Anaeramoeba ignava TaxID=1746090 RepID=A0A9Q0LUK7_ANAIG|nr:pep-cterm sorting domain-containing protein [Anaeramoeba ignava]
MRSFDRKDLTELAMHAIDKQIEDIISNQDYLLIGDEDLLEIIKRDTLNISNEFDLFKMVFDYSIRKYPNIVHQKKDDQKKDDQKKDDPKISLNDKSRDLLNNTFLNHIRFGSMEKGDEKINDILDFIENFADGDNKDNIRIIQKYQNQKIDWFKSKRHFFDEKLFDLTKELNLESNLIKIEKLNLPITKNCFFATYDSAILKWIDKEICDKLKLQFVSDSNDNYSCKEFHEICDNQGPIVVIIKSEGYIFGGFSSVGWIKNQNQNQNQNPYFIEDDKAFLFTLKSKNEEQQILKVIPEQKETALVYYSKRGPIFGDGWDLSISGNLKSGFSNLGLNYQLPDDIQYNSKESKKFLY